MYSLFSHPGCMISCESIAAFDNPLGITVLGTHGTCMVISLQIHIYLYDGMVCECALNCIELMYSE